MRKTKEVLRLRFELGLGQRAIARACSISQSTVHEYLNRAAAAGVVWPLGEEWDEQRVEQALFGERRVVKRLPEQVLPDFPALHSQLQQHRHLTLQLAWEEYRQVHPERGMATLVFVSSTSVRAGSKMWFFARYTNRVRRDSSTGPVPRFQYTIQLPARSGLRHFS